MIQLRESLFLSLSLPLSMMLNLTAKDYYFIIIRWTVVEEFEARDKNDDFGQSMNNLCPIVLSKDSWFVAAEGTLTRLWRGGNNGEARLSLHGLWLLLQIYYYGQ